MKIENLQEAVLWQELEESEMEVVNGGATDDGNPFAGSGASIFL
jgi:hypothetical protein